MRLSNLHIWQHRQALERCKPVLAEVVDIVSKYDVSRAQKCSAIIGEFKRPQSKLIDKKYDSNLRSRLRMCKRSTWYVRRATGTAGD